MSDVKFCIDCKYYREKKRFFSAEEICHHPSLRDPIHGKYLDLSPMKMRYNGPCREVGAMFEPLNSEV